MGEHIHEGRGAGLTDGGLARGIAAILCTGLILGGAYNLLGLKSRPSWGLDWIAKDKLDSLPALSDGDAAGEYRTNVSDPLAVPLPADSSLPEVPDVGRPVQIELAALKKFFDARAAVIIDAREPGEFAEGHIPGSVNLPYDEVVTDLTRLEQFDAGGKPIVTYCGGGGCELSLSLAEELVVTGHSKVLVYIGGFPEWVEAGYPVQQGPSGSSGSH